jgi:hyaluronoglucosaminidase
LSTFDAGVIEGFFGKSWDWPSRRSCVDFLSEHGYRFYVYAPKADAFLRRRWREPLPPATAQQLAQLGERCRQRGVAFGVGLTPFEIYLNYDADAKSSLRAKVRQLNDAGVDMLCILFDDMRGDVDDLPALQAAVIADVCAWSEARRFVVCPTYYSYDSRLQREFGPPPRAYLRDFGRLVDPAIDIFWTGEKVISAGYTAEHLCDVAEHLCRRPFIWDNYIANDSKVRTNHLYLDPSAGHWSLPSAMAAGVAINPMNQAHLSRIALGVYQRLLTRQSDAEEGILSTACRELCGPAFAAQLLADAPLLEIGLQDLDPQAHSELLQRYSMAVENPYAQEIAGWLRSEYLFDPQCLTN